MWRSRADKQHAQSRVRMMASEEKSPKRRRAALLHALAGPAATRGGSLPPPLLLGVGALLFFFTALWLLQLRRLDMALPRAAVADMPPANAGGSSVPQLLQQQEGGATTRGPRPAHRLLLASHNRLQWYDPDADELDVLHQGGGVHYGMFPGDPAPGHAATVWNVLRPHNWRPASEQEWLVQFDADTGEELQRVLIPSRFSHDAVRAGSFVYVCSTGDGAILQLSYPDMQLVRSMPLFSARDHPNTLAAADADGQHLWVVLHNLGDSDLVKVHVGDASTPPHEVQRLLHVGRKAHGLVAWGRELILLDSEAAVLVSLDPATQAVYDLWHVPEEGKFLKGLAVLDDVAYFGITTWAERSVRDSPDAHGELAAYDLVKGRLLWRRVVATAGLLNIIGAPHLAVDSTYAATYTPQLLPLGQPELQSGLLVLPSSAAAVAAAIARLREQGREPPYVPSDGYWSSGWPRLDLQPKIRDVAPETAGLQLPLFAANISALRTKVAALPAEAWTREAQAVSNAVMRGRDQNQARFKPGVQGLVLVFSDNAGQVVYEFPAWEEFRGELEPLLEEVLGPEDMNNIVRVQLALMAPGTSDIKMHQDSGGYAKWGHRIHIPLITHSGVRFEVCPASTADAAATASADAPPPAVPTNDDADNTQQPATAAPELVRGGGDDASPPSARCVTIPAPEGLVFELNNRVPHRVSNPGPGPRVHLVVDVYEEARPRQPLPPGSVCDYGGQLGPRQRLRRVVELAAALGNADALAAEVSALLSAPGMECFGPDGVRVPARFSADAEAAAQLAVTQVMDALAVLGQQLQQQGSSLSVDEVTEALVQTLLQQQETGNGGDDGSDDAVHFSDDDGDGGASAVYEEPDAATDTA